MVIGLEMQPQGLPKTSSWVFEVTVFRSAVVHRSPAQAGCRFLRT